MARQNVKDDIASRILEIKSRVIAANKVYRDYLSKGAAATVNDYLQVERAVEHFYRDEFVPVSDPRGHGLDETHKMFGGFKSHSMMACRRALKAMNKELEKTGVSAEDMIAFRDPLAEDMAAKIANFENDCHNINFKKNGMGDAYSHCSDAVDKILYNLRRMKLSELQVYNLPDPTKVIDDAAADFEKILAGEVAEYKKRLKAVDSDYKKYQKKGETATFEEYEKISSAVYGAVQGLKYGTTAKQVAIAELAEEKVAIAEEMAQSGSYYLRTIYEDKAASIISCFKRDVEKLVSEKDEYVWNKYKEFVSTLKKMPMDKLIKEDLPSPNYFVRMAKEQKAKDEAAATAEAKTPKQKQ